MHRSIIPHSKAVDLKENIPGLKSHDMVGNYLKGAEFAHVL